MFTVLLATLIGVVPADFTVAVGHGAILCVHVEHREASETLWLTIRGARGTSSAYCLETNHVEAVRLHRPRGARWPVAIVTASDNHNMLYGIDCRPPTPRLLWETSSPGKIIIGDVAHSPLRIEVERHPHQLGGEALEKEAAGRRVFEICRVDARELTSVGVRFVSRRPPQGGSAPSSLRAYQSRGMGPIAPWDVTDLANRDRVTSDRILARAALPGHGRKIAAVVEASDREFPELKTESVVVKDRGRIEHRFVLLDGVHGAEVHVLKPTSLSRPQFWVRNAGADHFGESVVGFVGPTFKPKELYSYAGRAEVEVWAGATVHIRENYSFGIAFREIPKKFTDHRRKVVRDLAFDSRKGRFIVKRDFHYEKL